MKTITTYSTLGDNGRLGNQMFQYATLLSKAATWEGRFAIPDSLVQDGKQKSYELIDSFANLSAEIVNSERMSEFHRTQLGVYRESDFSFDQNFGLVHPHVELFGYFQSELYFKNHRAQILKEFQFSEEVKNTVKKSLSIIKSSKGADKLCAVHIRRGDYVNLSNYHTNLGPEYYSPAMQHILGKLPGKIQFVVFSDDIEWCKSFILDREQVTFSTFSNHLEDLYAISCCNYHIIANSSFSWWGAWLSNTECTIAPKAWFGPEGPPNWQSIYPATWLVG